MYTELSGSEDEEGVAALEEKESLAIQQRLAAQLDEDDFGIAQLVQVLSQVSVIKCFKIWSLSWIYLCGGGWDTYVNHS